MIGRIHGHAAFDDLRRNGLRVRIGPLWCTFLADPSTTPPRVAFAIGRRAGNAVTRNRLRRRLRAILADADVPAGSWLIGAGAPATELTFEELTSATRDLLAAAHRPDRW